MTLCLKRQRKTGSTLRGHHIPQQQRLREHGINPNDGIVVVLEHSNHIQTRTYGRKGAKIAMTERGKSLGYSQNLDLQDDVVKSLGKDVSQKIKRLNKQLISKIKKL